MDNAGLRRLSRNRIRVRHEVVCRVHAADTWAVHGCYRLVECFSSLTRAPDASSRNGVRDLDRHRRRGYRHSGYRSVRRLRVTSAAALHFFDCSRRDWTKACLCKLRMPLTLGCPFRPDRLMLRRIRRPPTHRRVARVEAHRKHSGAVCGNERRRFEIRTSRDEIVIRPVGRSGKEPGALTDSCGSRRPSPISSLGWRR